MRTRAALALARLQRPTVSLYAALDDGDAEVRANVAFAVGQLGLAWEDLPAGETPRAEGRLIASLGRERNTSVRVALLEALGKVGGADALAELAQRIRSGDPAEREASAIAVGIVAYRTQAKLWDAALDEPLARAARGDDARLRFAATYAAMRASRAAVEARPELRKILRERLADPDPDVRATASRGLGEVAQDQDWDRLGALASDPVPRVGAEAARALAKAAVRCDKAPCAALTRLASALGTHIPLAPLVYVAAFNEPIRDAAFAAAADEAAKRLATRASCARGKCLSPAPTRPESPAGDLELAACHAAFAADRARGRVSAVPTCGGLSAPERKRSQLVARVLAEAKGQVPRRLEMARELARSNDVAVRSAAMDALVAEGGDEAKAVVRGLLGDPDAMVASGAAEAAAKLGDAAACEPLAALLARPAMTEAAGVEAAQSALLAVADLKAPCASVAAKRFLESRNESVRQAARKALGALLGQPPDVVAVAEVPGPYADLDLPRRPRVRIATARGAVDVELLADDAPTTVRNFLYLVRRRYFDGLTLHRVVPNFVVQGGDPRGDGSGGPGYSIRCEINRRPYEPGMVGMALSGKDTGGSQFFITTSRQPHLDGRYTVFGRVEAGQEVAEAAMEGDVMTRVEELP